MNPKTGNSALWTPSPERVADTRLTSFITHLAGDAGVPVSDYASLHGWSVEEPEAFWSAVWDWSEVIGTKGDQVIEYGRDLVETRFFVGAELNFAENLLHGRGVDGDHPALIFRSETTEAEVSWDELRSQSASIAAALVGSGGEVGDRVAAWLPNIVEGYAAMLGTASMGATFTSTSPDFGATGVIERFGQTEPKVLFVTDGYSYAGKPHRIIDRVADVVAELPSVTTVVVVPTSASPNV